VRVALYQFDPCFGEVDSNLEQVEAALSKVDAKADLWILPELFSTGYTFASRSETASLAEAIDGPTVGRVIAWAKELNCAIAFGFAEESGGTLYNSGAIVDGNGVRMHYRKLHLFDREKLVFEAGNLPLEVLDIAGVRCGMMICFDWRFPETARSLGFLGADLLVHPSNLVLPWCPDAMITRALENNVFIATCDRWGVEERAGQRLRFIGSSQVVNPRGERLAALGEEEDGWIAVDIDPADARNKQVNAHNHLHGDRRPEFYCNDPRVVSD
jgi:predicted amidohydrolase